MEINLRDLRFVLKTHYTKSRALVIGINKYKNASPLSYAVSDAEEIRNVLTSNLDFPTENITYLTDTEATKENILRNFLRFARADVDIDERILIFFAGHGHTITGSRGEVGFLVPYDADLDDLSTLIRWDDLTRNAELIRAKHILFIMDACYGGLAVTRNTSAGSSRFLKDMMLRYSRQVLTAGKADEVVSDSGGPLPNHSVFTGHLIEGLRGNAATENGVITANGVMSYVYGKVANDGNSNQTPHYGYFDGDGDFIFIEPALAGLEKIDEKDVDSLVIIPYSEEVFTVETITDKVKRIKSLLSNEAASIELHDFITSELKQFLSGTSEDNFSVQAQYSIDELLDRISKYEKLVSELSLLLACMAYWFKPANKSVLQKVFARSTDRINSQGGNVALLALRWYPLIIMVYRAGIAAVDGRNYDSLANIFFTVTDSSEYKERTEFLVEVVSEKIVELSRYELFKKLPGYEKFYTPMSEYLYKILQPDLDDVLFIGKNYEKSFDEFEVLFALVVADARTQNQQTLWGPIGRFGWKGQHNNNAPLQKIIKEAQAIGNDWGPLKAGLFGGDIKRFNDVSASYQNEVVSKLHWW